MAPVLIFTVPVLFLTICIVPGSGLLSNLTDARLLAEALAFAVSAGATSGFLHGLSLLSKAILTGKES